MSVHICVAHGPSKPIESLSGCQVARHNRKHTPPISIQQLPGKHMQSFNKSGDSWTVPMARSSHKIGLPK